MARQRLERLPKHRVPAAARRRAAQPALEVTGLVAKPGQLTMEAVQALPSFELAEAFQCEEGWTTPTLVWRGPLLRDVLALAHPLPEARWVRVVAGPFAVPLALDSIGGAILATQLNGDPLSVEHGGPWRLVVPGAACFTSVKWVERIEVTAESGEDTGQAIARRRLG